MGQGRRLDRIEPGPGLFDLATMSAAKGVWSGLV